MSAVIYHPETGATIIVPPESVPHYRQSGWLLRSEHDANEAAKADAEAKAAAKADDKKPTREEK